MVSFHGKENEVLLTMPGSFVTEFFLSAMYKEVYQNILIFCMLTSTNWVLFSIGGKKDPLEGSEKDPPEGSALQDFHWFSMTDGNPRPRLHEAWQ